MSTHEPAETKRRVSTKTVMIAAVVIAPLLVALIFLLKSDLLGKRAKEPSVLLEPGWQFYTKPTSSEPPGTVFRIDAAGRRFTVDVIQTPFSTATEVFGRTEQAIQTNAKTLSR